MDGLEKEWLSYPVLHIDMNVTSYKDVGDLETGLDTNLRRFEKIWGLGEQAKGKASSARFYDLIQTVCEQSGRKAVVLVDEYDRPLINTMERDIENEEIRTELKGFYGVLKSADRWLRFTLLTGVTKFSKVSLFSDLNMLRDISMNAAYAGVCGMSAREIEENFKSELGALAEANDMTYDEAVAEMKKRYDGYHFCEDSEGMFNPFSVLNTLADRKFAYYWFKTGTPTFLVEQLKRGNFDPLRFAEGVTIPARSIDDYRAEGGNPVPLLYQSGYLTIAGYDKEFDRYALDFPNEEVRYGFLEELLPYYTYMPPGGEFFADRFIEDLRANEIDGFMTRMRALFANIPYDLNEETERYYHLVFYLVFTLLGQYTRAEVHGHKGRADAVVETKETVYVFEFKLNGTVNSDRLKPGSFRMGPSADCEATGDRSATAEEALKQIDDKGYAIPYTAGKRRVVKIGVAFDKDERNIGRWLAEDGGK
jgi:hypothetical protein